MKKTIILLGIILSIIFVTECSNNSDRVGNTDDEILEYLHKDFMTNIGNDNLTIVDTIYIDNSKIVGFLSDTGQGYFVYEKIKKVII
ncbi:hypothetical protein [Terrisporobacter sp.]|uniref:hypothetical protein n=1 Tax=Terrisporobacter sp. TaxID=1965305 RepID=UPI0026048B24|nr:hypothetical protein [Terrisporobacter sp.]